MLKKLLKPVLFSGLGLLVLGVVAGIGITLSARKQDAEIDAIAQNFLQGHPSTTTNDSAKTLGVLASDLGMSSLTGYPEDNVTLSNPAQSEALQAISQHLRDYITTQSKKTQGTLDPIPENLQTYLDQHRDSLTAIQSHLLTSELPVWNFDTELLSDLSYPAPSFVGLTQVQQLLSLKAISDYQQQQLTEMNTALEANLIIHQAIAQRPELISYLVSLLAMNTNVGIMRHLEGVSPELSSQLLAINQQQLGYESLRFDVWTRYKGFQQWAKNSPNFAEDSGSEFVGVAMINYLPFQRSYFTLSNADMARRTDLSYRQLPELTVCSASLDDIGAQLHLTAAWWDLWNAGITPSFVRQWQKGGETGLAAELTHHVTTAKALAAEQGQWPESLPNLDSTTCPGEQWVYDVSPAGEMSLSFSHELAWLATQRENEIQNRWTLPLTYQAASMN